MAAAIVNMSDAESAASMRAVGWCAWRSSVTSGACLAPARLLRRLTKSIRARLMRRHLSWRYPCDSNDDDSNDDGGGDGDGNERRARAQTSPIRVGGV